MSDAAQVSVSGRDLQCKHCGHGRFHHKTAALDRMVMGGFSHLEGWWGHQTVIYVCARCGFAHLFMEVSGAEHRIGEAVAERTARRPPARAEGDCLSCGKAIPADADCCPACGWTWAAESGAE